jgi:hypothetical protein
VGLLDELDLRKIAKAQFDQCWKRALPFHEKAGRCQEAFVFE